MSDKPVEGGGGKTPEKDRNLGRDSYSFTNLPDKITRNILRCLRFSDLLNLRAVSKGLLMTVNSLDSRLPGWKMKTYYEADLDDYDDYEDFNNFIIMHEPNKDVVYYESNKDIRVVLTNEFNKHERDLLQEDGGRVVDLTSPLKGLLCDNKMEKLKNLKTYGDKEYEELDMISFIPPMVFKSMKNLQVLSLENLNIDELKHSKFSLPHLKEISLNNVTGLYGLPNLLSSCPATLEKLELKKMEIEYEHLLGVNVASQRLKSLTLQSVDVENLCILISKFSKRLQELNLCQVKDYYLEHYARDYRLDLKFSLPELKELILEKCSQELLIILKCSSPKLTNIKLNVYDGTILSKLEYDISSVASLTLWHDFEIKPHSPNSCPDTGSDLLKIIEKAAPNLQELDISNLKCEFKTVVPEFPNLRKLLLHNCRPNLETSIVAHSPKLKNLTLYKLRLNAKKKYKLPETIEYLEFISTCKNNQLEFQGISEHLAMFSTSLKHLSINYTIFKSWQPLHYGLDKLRKLTLTHCVISSGFENLLQACQSTLEELEIYNRYGCVVLDEISFKMRSLKNLLIECRESKLAEDVANITRLSTVHKLVSRCPYLEKLVLGVPSSMNKSDLTHLQYCYLPNLKIVQVYPKPTDENMKLIKDTFSDNVTYWFFPVPNASDYIPGF